MNVRHISSAFFIIVIIIACGPKSSGDYSHSIRNGGEFRLAVGLAGALNDQLVAKSDSIISKAGYLPKELNIRISENDSFYLVYYSPKDSMTVGGDVSLYFLKSNLSLIKLELGQ